MKQKTFETILYSSAGVAAMFVLVIACYVVLSATKLRLDVTADRAHTLSPGTRHILGKIGSRVTIRFYCTQSDNAMPPALRAYARHVEDLLEEYKEAARGKITLQKLDPKPDTDAEDSARLNGIEGQATGPFAANKIYLGLVVSVFDQKFALPWLAPERERLLEYDISRAIERVENSTPPVIGIMSAMPVFGIQANPLTMHRDEQPAGPWGFVTELKKDFTVKDVLMTASHIDDSISVLIVMHPRNISDMAQYAIDQFVLRGGKLLAFVDPHAYFDESNDQQNRPFQVVGENAYGQSSLDKLFPAWGLQMNMDKVVADMVFGSRNMKTGESRPTILLIGRAGINLEDVMASQMDNLALPFPGAFTGKPAPGLKESVLVHSSTNSQLIDTLMATAPGEQIARDLKADGVPYALAVHLTGNFKTAFPNGPPGGPDPAQLKESGGRGEVVLMADTDMLNDKASVQARTVMGHRVVHPINGNLNFVQGIVELFSGDEDLISSRGRASASRPFTRLEDMEARAGRQWEEKIHVLEMKQHEMERMISELQTHKDSSDEEKVILTPEQQSELENYEQTRAQIGKDLKVVRRNLRKDTDALQFWTKVVDISAMPALVAVSGLALAIAKHQRRRSAVK